MRRQFVGEVFPDEPKYISGGANDFEFVSGNEGVSGCRFRVVGYDHRGKTGGWYRKFISKVGRQHSIEPPSSALGDGCIIVLFFVCLEIDVSDHGWWASIATDFNTNIYDINVTRQREHLYQAVNIANDVRGYNCTGCSSSGFVDASPNEIG